MRFFSRSHDELPVSVCVCPSGSFCRCLFIRGSGSHTHILFCGEIQRWVCADELSVSCSEAWLNYWPRAFVPVFTYKELRGMGVIASTSSNTHSALRGSGWEMPHWWLCGRVLQVGGNVEREEFVLFDVDWSLILWARLSAYGLLFGEGVFNET